MGWTWGDVAHNHAPEPQRNHVLSSPLENYRECFLGVRCPGKTCPELRWLPLARLVRDHGDARMEEVIGRLRCELCHQRPARVSIRRVGADGVFLQSDLVLDLVGPGVRRFR
ncbi:hypothetical protein [Roseomonas indoligenes]|uniref:Transposase n=1 Tax=Roseomonas indoligenes TaxID=2820811 RepID=A0A940S4M7_9PROT|nr:hypothetical protein [Pararoseomonas indoligenes]MBP0492130.1 hypothetical protein [Pararoseomonas indoligenes]